MAMLDKIRAKQQQAGTSEGPLDALVPPAPKKKKVKKPKQNPGPAFTPADPNSKKSQHKVHKQGMRRINKERLPDGSAFVVLYDGPAQVWRGTLTVGDKRFTNSRSGLFKLLVCLDDMYRASL